MRFLVLDLVSGEKVRAAIKSDNKIVTYQFSYPVPAHNLSKSEMVDFLTAVKQQYETAAAESAAATAAATATGAAPAATAGAADAAEPMAGLMLVCSAATDTLERAWWQEAGRTVGFGLVKLISANLAALLACARQWQDVDGANILSICLNQDGLCLAVDELTDSGMTVLERVSTMILHPLDFAFTMQRNDNRPEQLIRDYCWDQVAGPDEIAQVLLIGDDTVKFFQSSLSTFFWSQKLNLAGPDDILTGAVLMGDILSSSSLDFMVLELNPERISIKAAGEYGKAALECGCIEQDFSIPCSDEIKLWLPPDGHEIHDFYIYQGKTLQFSGEPALIGRLRLKESKAGRTAGVMVTVVMDMDSSGVLNFKNPVCSLPDCTVTLELERLVAGIFL